MSTAHFLCQSAFDDAEREVLVDQLRDARNQIVRLQRELERARGVIADQQSLLVRTRATRKVRR